MSELDKVAKNARGAFDISSHDDQHRVRSLADDLNAATSDDQSLTVLSADASRQLDLRLAATLARRQSLFASAQVVPKAKLTSSGTDSSNAEASSARTICSTVSRS